MTFENESPSRRATRAEPAGVTISAPMSHELQLDMSRCWQTRCPVRKPS